MVRVDGVEYSTTKNWLDWINKASRPQMAKFLQRHWNGKILGSTPSDKDIGTPLMLIVATKGERYGKPCYYCVSSQVMQIDKTRKEAYCEYYVSMGEAKKLLALHGEQQQGATYNPDIEYVVSRTKTGRPRAALTDDEKAQIAKWRAEGRGYNRIAADLRRSNKLIIAYCKEAGIRPMCYSNNQGHAEK